MKGCCSSLCLSRRPEPTGLDGQRGTLNERQKEIQRIRLRLNKLKQEKEELYKANSLLQEQLQQVSVSNK